ncbi:MAG: DNA-binding response regulator [Chloroflexi bacterium HGW-Chloroflexi-1]|nr:MAG: DNA-binding response regulator [Chloroflexi bacterium HGW-Chloroflexi-1]
MPGDKICLMIVEDHPLFREGLRRVVEVAEDLEVIAEVGDGEQAIEAAKTLKPDVILMDINLPKLNGLQATRQIVANQEDAKIIVLTAYHDDEQLFHALKAGAAAYYPKHVSPDTLIKAIHAIHEGNFVIGDDVMAKPQVAAWLIRQFEELAVFDESPYEMFAPLSIREMDILQLIARGASNKEIGRELSISRQTVKNHMSSILRKLAVNDRTQAAVLALRRGWIRLEDTKPLG